MPSHTKAVNNAPPVEIMTIKKCKNMINDLLRGEGSINESSKIFEISDQLIYVYLTKILINLGRYSVFIIYIIRIFSRIKWFKTNHNGAHSSVKPYWTR